MKGDRCEFCDKPIGDWRETYAEFGQTGSTRSFYCSDGCYNAHQSELQAGLKKQQAYLDELKRQSFEFDWNEEWDATYEKARKEHLVWLAHERKAEEKEYEREREAEQKEYERELEMAQKQFDKDYIAGEKEHADYLDAEAFQEALKPKPILPHIRFEHTHIIGGSGSGKTSLIQQLFINDLPNRNAYIIIDPKGEMVARLSLLDIPSIVIDPTKDPLPALDLFHQGSQSPRIRNNLIEMFAYIFSTAKAQLTQKQSIPFEYLVRLVFHIGGNIDTLMDMLEDNPKDRRFYSVMQQLGEQDRGARRFFENDCYSTGFNETRQQIKTRLYEIISKPELMEMLACGQNKLSIFDCIQQRKIVLVNTASLQLGSTTSQLLGRYFIAATLNAAFARSEIPKREWNPAFLIIDEFQDMADEIMTPRMLRLAREYNLGIFIAHQNMFRSEFNDSIRNSISTNTSIKYAASPEGADLGYMARDMRCEPDFLKMQTKHGGIAKFACYVRGMNLTHPFSYPVDLGFCDRQRTVDPTNRLKAQREALKPHSQVKQKPQAPITSQPIQQPSAPEQHKPVRKPDTPIQPPAKSAPTDPHAGDHTEPASNWGE